MYTLCWCLFATQVGVNYLWLLIALFTRDVASILTPRSREAVSRRSSALAWSRLD